MPTVCVEAKPIAAVERALADGGDEGRGVPAAAALRRRVDEVHTHPVWRRRGVGGHGHRLPVLPQENLPLLDAGGGRAFEVVFGLSRFRRERPRPREHGFQMVRRGDATLPRHVLWRCHDISLVDAERVPETHLASG